MFLQEDGCIDVAMDANFGLVHKRNSGVSYAEHKLTSRYFLDQKMADAFVEKHSQETKRGGGVSVVHVPGIVFWRIIHM